MFVLGFVYWFVFYKDTIFCSLEAAVERMAPSLPTSAKAYCFRSYLNTHSWLSCGQAPEITPPEVKYKEILATEEMNFDRGTPQILV